MPDKSNVPIQPASIIPPDNLERNLAVAQPNTDQKLPHVGVAGDTYTHTSLHPAARSVNRARARRVTQTCRGSV